MRSAFLAVLALGCAGLPPPDPPRLELLRMHPIASDLEGEHVLVVGEPGAAFPTLDVAAFNLDGTLPPGRGFVAADGSFLVEVHASVGHTLRIHTAEAGRSSEPLDFVAGERVGVLAEPALGCLHVPASVSLAQSALLTLANDCAQPVGVARVAPRAPAAFVVRDESPFILEAGARRHVRVERAEGGPIDEVVIVEVAAPTAERRAVTVFGE